ncbi:ABC transporter substrate-binding protein [Corynebacterium bovis]|uniref:ABC transporter substrate-binding protein n=10 Tax=Corynebacterium bovis TaxID=36808 RepID=A0A3R8R4N4_9CORY|nr:ABC transporter substrate-binding protein [Corynebacterium bovis]RRQ00166.1 ABC transporter substrate-binding protein [Corynebacterium bovis]RRQ03250.1 ABC transporter substrate-binding protein [Corynebacterium bovis]RRQ10480.1 ABC transporter substrate-binding protein [Corynebacterium bovis]
MDPHPDRAARPSRPPHLPAPGPRDPRAGRTTRGTLTTRDRRAPRDPAGRLRAAVTRATTVLAALLVAAVGLTACGGDPLATGGGDDGTVTVGAANFPESEIVAQLYVLTLRDAGVDADLRAGIGSRDVYLSALQAGDIDVVPEYSGNLAQYYAADDERELRQLGPGADGRAVDRVLDRVLPDSLETGDPARAESKDAYRVLRSVAQEHHLKTLSDLAGLDRVRIAGNPELATRPYGPDGIASVYGVDRDRLSVTPVSDGGGPLTVTALTDGTVEVADVYTTSPVTDRTGHAVDTVTLADPKNLILPQNVLPVMRRDRLPQHARDRLRDVQFALTTKDLLDMNRRSSGEEKAEPETIARDWLMRKGLIGA